MKLLVGLGNPGREYAGTRHNVGFDVVAELNRRGSASAPKVKFESELSEVQVGSERVLILAPQTFMNLSGRAVRKAIDFYQLAPADLLVMCDDLNLACGRIRLRRGGSAGGQKGLENIIQHMGTQEFARLRVGIDRPSGSREVVGYVLGRFSAAESELIAPAIQRAAAAAEVWVTEGLEVAMNRYNSDSASAAGSDSTQGDQQKRGKSSRKGSREPGLE